jgi:hypothetical protein
VRCDVLVPAALFSQRVFQNISLPEKKARLTPASRAASTLSRCEADQYSSWPEEMNSLCLRINDPRMAVSTELVYDMSYPLRSMKRIIGYSAPLKSAVRPLSSSATCSGRL